MYAGTEGSGESGRMRRLACAFGARRYNKYQNLQCWANFSFFSRVLLLLCTVYIMSTLVIELLGLGDHALGGKIVGTWRPCSGW